jgi:cytochrome c biogenesis protein CcmG, thiol:disulfide interchange protein DsbE
MTVHVSRRPIIWIAAAAAALAGAGFITRLTGDSVTASPDGPIVVSVSGPMPELSGTALQGSTIDPATYRGRPVVVNFWATWCGPCRREQPTLAAADRAAGSDGPVFIGVLYRDNAAAGRAFVDEYHVPYPSLRDPSGSLAYRFDLVGMPSTIFVDANGRMRYRVTGALDAATLREFIAKISRPA